LPKRVKRQSFLTEDDDELIEYRIDAATPGRTIEGWAELGSAETEQVWRIRSVDVVGSSTHRFFLDNSSQFVNKWSDRNTDLPTLAFLNEFSLQLSGATNSYLTVADSADIEFDNNEAFSIQIYWKTTNGAAILFQKTSTAAGNNGYTMTLDSSGRLEFSFRGTGTGDRIRVRTDSFTDGANGSWHHVIVTKSTATAASSVTIYVDGSSETLNVLNDTLTGVTTNADVLGIGASITGTSRFTGNIDEFAIWNAELTSAEVTEVYNTNSGAIDLETGSTQISSALTCYIRFGDGSFSALPTIPDEKGSNDATAQAAVTSGDLETEVSP